MASVADLDALEAQLRAILEPYGDELEAAEIYGLEVLRRPGARAHDWFAGVSRTDGVVKFSFLPMHSHPELLEGVSAALRRSRTGASVFRFTELDQAGVSEVTALVARGFVAYMRRSS